MSCKVYLAMKMTGLQAKEITEKSEKAKELMLKWGLNPVSPWDKEKNFYDPEAIINAPTKDLYKMWKEDKQEVTSCHVVCDMDGNLFSRGTGVEVGYNRYALMRPTIFVDTAMVSIRNFEADYIAQTIEDAAHKIASQWATPSKRRVWRLKTVWNFKVVWNRIKREIQGWR
jgi:hypothetical protein